MSRSLFRRLVLTATTVALVGLVVTVLHPVNSTLLRLGLLASVGGLWLGSLILLWNFKPLRWSLLGLPVAMAIAFVLPGRPPEPDALRERYLARLERFDGTPYHWGGENARGIDCSGLPRKALREALLLQGLAGANGWALREAASQWWFDTSAKAMGEGYRGNTIPVGVSGTVRDLDGDRLAPGDLAVTDSGVHVMVYFGNGRWIQAAPEVGFVTTLNGKKDDNAWFGQPVTIHRWRVLDNGSGPRSL